MNLKGTKFPIPSLQNMGSHVKSMEKLPQSLKGPFWTYQFPCTRSDPSSHTHLPSPIRSLMPIQTAWSVSVIPFSKRKYSTSRCFAAFLIWRIWNPLSLQALRAENQSVCREKEALTMQSMQFLAKLLEFVYLHRANVILLGIGETSCLGSRRTK